MAWQPEQVKLDQVGQLLQGCADPTNHERHVQALQVRPCSSTPYLAVVWCANLSQRHEGVLL
eukprot:3661028-Rhodomonas_salina.3